MMENEEWGEIELSLLKNRMAVDKSKKDLEEALLTDAGYKLPKQKSKI